MAQWWDDWELRILVLASLSAQYFLVLFAGLRKFHIPPLVRFSFRMAHIGSDALAIFALATLFSRHKTHGSRDLELLWAPVLLMHLGGQVVITTYKIEDNEQWRRHILISLSKVTVALYVFYKSWSSNDKKLLAATILLFILVIIRCFQKSLDLKSSSFNALRKANSSVSSVNGGNHNFFIKIETLEEFVFRARAVSAVRSHGEPLTTLASLPCQLFLDFPSSYSDRFTMVKNFWPLSRERAYQAIEGALSGMTSFLYTKDDSTPYLAFKSAPAALIFRWCTQILAYATVATAICLVHISSYKEAAYSSEDTGVTLVLLYGTLLLELVYFCVHSAFRDKFSGRILQHNLIGLFLRNRRHSGWRRVAGWLQCNDLLDDFWHMGPCYSCEEITELVRLHVRWWWKHHMTDAAQYRRLNGSRGLWTLEQKGCHRRIGLSMKRPFDESVILWHLATDLCLHQCADTPANDHQCARQCKEMSNYMMHLLFDNPEMLMPGSRKSLFADACIELERILEGVKTPLGEKELARLVFDRCDASSTNKSLIGDALRLAQGLLMCSNESRIWEVIQGVWVEMLCFSAGRCRGYLHAETLGTGVEYLSYVWVLLAHSGMETFPEKLQMRESQSFDEDDNDDDDDGIVTIIAGPTDLNDVL